VASQSFLESSNFSSCMGDELCYSDPPFSDDVLSQNARFERPYLSSVIDPLALFCLSLNS